MEAPGWDLVCWRSIRKASVVAAEGAEDHSKVRKITTVKVLWDQLPHCKVFGFCF